MKSREFTPCGVPELCDSCGALALCLELRGLGAEKISRHPSSPPRAPFERANIDGRAASLDVPSSLHGAPRGPRANPVLRLCRDEVER